MSEITQDELERQLTVLNPKSDAQRNNIVCAIIGHSRIQDYCFGYYSCARCGQQLGDSLASVYPAAESVVIVGHNCETCRTNYEQLTWRDKLYAPDPFKDEEATATTVAE